MWLLHWLLQLPGPSSPCWEYKDTDSGLSGWAYLTFPHVPTHAALTVIPWRLHMVQSLVPHSQEKRLVAITNNETGFWLLPHTTTTVLRTFFRDQPGKLVPDENFWTSWCKGRLTEVDTTTIRQGATPFGLTSAHLHQPPFFYRPDALPAAQPTVSKHRRQQILDFNYQLWRFLITESTDQTLVERQSIYNASKHKLARLTIEMLCQRIIDIYG